MAFEASSGRLTTADEVVVAYSLNMVDTSGGHVKLSKLVEGGGDGANIEPAEDTPDVADPDSHEDSTSVMHVTST